MESTTEVLETRQNANNKNAKGTGKGTRGIAYWGKDDPYWFADQKSGIACIPLTDGTVALVDHDLIDRFKNYRWAIKKSGHVFRRLNVNGKKKTLHMHHVVLPAKAGLHVDHINGNPRDNRSFNLRYVFPWENCMNGRPPLGPSGFRGVSLTVRGKWRARIKVKGVWREGGSYETIIEAAQARAELEKKYGVADLLEGNTHGRPLYPTAIDAAFEAHLAAWIVIQEAELCR